MTRRIIFLMVWSVSLFLLSAIVLLVGWKIYFAATGATAVRPRDSTLTWLGATMTVIPLLFGIVGAVLGVLGVLPGTKKEKRS
jgi:hypothetical protein